MVIINQLNIKIQYLVHCIYVLFNEDLRRVAAFEPASEVSL